MAGYAEAGGCTQTHMAEARKDRRTLLSLKIRYKSATLEDFIERYSTDISRGGVFIKAKKPLAVGTLLKFEFMLQDESMLIHGVGRVVWRRDEAESDSSNPPGMGIKFIKMDAGSRSVVQRIADDRARPGVFDHGKEGVPSEPAPSGGDPTRVRHVSEFLASAFEEGGADAATTREAQAGAERAREMSHDVGAARGAFSASSDSGQRKSISDAPARGAMSAFGGSGGRMQSSAAPAMDEYDAEDDFLDNETTKVQELPSASEFPDAAATVVASEAPFVADKLQTPVVPADARPSSPLEEAVPDLFGPDSFGPAPGELIDASLLDPAVGTVPPKASALPRGAVPDAPGIPNEAFRVPQAPAPVGSQPPAKTTTGSRPVVLLVLFALLLATAGTALWQLGLTEELANLVAPVLGQSEEPVVSAPRSVPNAAPTPAPAEPSAPAEDPASATGSEEAAEVAADSAPSAPASPASPATAGLVKFRIVSVPSGAFVSINRKGAGRTPVDVEYQPGTRLSIYSKARGHLARRHRMTVEAGQPEVKLVLSPLPWVVEIESAPSGASASAVGGGQTTTPGTLTFRSMGGSRKIVVSKDGYGTATKSVTRLNFVEEKSRMAASVRVTLEKEGSAAPAEAPEASVKPAEPEPAAAPPEPKAAPEPNAAAEPAAEPVEEAPAPSEPASADAP